MSEAAKPIDYAGVSYWDRVWKGSRGGALTDPCARGIRNHVFRRFHILFSEVLRTAGAVYPGSRLIEIGCAQSFWLPYFHRQLGFQVSGLDYSEVGCHSAREILEANGVPGEIVNGDLFGPPSHMLGAFDVVFSMGLVEHFADTTGCVGALSRFLRPGGVMVTTIPNMVGATGTLQKLVNRAVYDIHVPLDREGLRRAHEGAALDVLHCEYFIFANAGVLNIGGAPAPRVAKFVTRVLYLASLVVWTIEGDAGRLPVNRLTSPYVICVARKRGG
jgi:2-polyprenyl-3-methyl-5-hydroxy-6-metoxy-1,4-benzoquinol methylase